MTTAVERNGQTGRLITFLRRLFYKLYAKTSQILTKHDVKTKYKYKRWISFFCCSSKYERNGSYAKSTSRSLHETHCVHASMNNRQNETYFLNDVHKTVLSNDAISRTKCDFSTAQLKQSYSCSCARVLLNLLKSLGKREDDQLIFYPSFFNEFLNRIL